MRKQTKVGTACLGAILTLAAVGCGGQDAEGLARVCQKVSERGEDLTGGRHSKLANSWQALRGAAGDSALDSRVAIRLNWDNALADADIRVSVTSPSVVTLQGTLTNPSQRGRALELARSTQGVTDVVDALEMKAELPAQ